MSQPIKYNIGVKTAGCCIRKNYFDIGITPNFDYGPTNSTDFWNGYTPVQGGFVSYKFKGSSPGGQGPSIYDIPSINEIQAYGTQLDIGTTLTTDIGVVIASANNPGTLLVNIEYPPIPYVDNNIFTIDAGYTPSFPWATNTWSDISGTANFATLAGSSVFVTGNSIYNYSDSYIEMPASSENSMALASNLGVTLDYFSINVWVKVNSSNGWSSNQNVFGQQYSNDPSYTPNNNCNFLIRGNNFNGLEGLIRVNGVNYTCDFGNIPIGSWTMLTLTYQPGEMITYVNTVAQNTTSVSEPFLVNNGEQLIIGGTTNAYANSGNVSDYLDASISVVNVYDILLSINEILSLYNMYQSQRGY